MPRSDQFPTSKFAALRERRLRREESGRDPDYERARRRQERQAIQEAMLYANVDTRSLDCRDGSYRDRTRAVSNHIDSLTTRRGPFA
jgi:hypothetical protein